MMRIDENHYFNIRALASAIDKCLLQVNDSKSVELDNAIMLSGMLVQEFEKVDEEK